jgi:hypothetical protein
MTLIKRLHVQEYLAAKKIRAMTRLSLHWLFSSFVTEGSFISKAKSLELGISDM